MHELGLVNYVVKEVDKIARENGVEKVRSVTLEFGEVSNTYNFILPNVLLHLIAAVCISGLTFSYTHGDY